jgi:hypothetical protein
MAYRECIRCVFECLPALSSRGDEHNKACAVMGRPANGFRSLGAVQCEIWAGPGVKRRAQITGCSPVVRLIEPSKDQDGDD